MSGNPMLTDFLNKFGGGAATVTAEQFTTFLSSYLGNPKNFEVVGSTVTALYSGGYSGSSGTAQSYQMAQDLAARSGGKIRIIDNTDMGKFLTSVFGDGPNRIGLANVDSYTKSTWGDASFKFGQNTEGRVITLTSTSGTSSSYYQRELDGMLSGNGVTKINGFDFKELEASLLNQNPNDMRAAMKVIIDGAAADALAAQGSARIYAIPDGVDSAGNKIFTNAILDIDSGTMLRLGAGDVALASAATNGDLILSGDALLSVLRPARALRLEAEQLVNTIARAKSVDFVKLLGTDPLIAQDAKVKEAISATEALLADTDAARIIKVFSPNSLMREAVHLQPVKSNQTLIRFVNANVAVISEGAAEAPSLFKNVLDGLIDGIAKAATSPHKLKLGLTLGAALLAGGELWAEYEKNKDKPGGFVGYLKTLPSELLSGLISPTGIGLILVGQALGPVFDIALGGALVYSLLHNILHTYVTTYAPGQGQTASWVYTELQYLDDWLNSAEDKIQKRIAQAVSDFVGGAVKLGVHLLEEYTGSKLRLVGGEGAIFADDKPSFALGDDVSLIIGGDSNDILFHKGAGEIYGGLGDDTLIGFFAPIIHKGEALDSSIRMQEAAATASYDAWVAAGKPGKQLTSPIPFNGAAHADHDFNLILDGGEGADWVIAMSGEKVTTIGGAGRDWIYNTSAGGIIYGDTIDGLDPLTHQSIHAMEDSGADIVNGQHAFSDTVWWSSNSIVMDAGHYDHLKFFGLPLVGGDTSGGIALQLLGGPIGGLAGVAIGAAQTFTPIFDAWYFDYIMPAIQYKMDFSKGRHDLLVINVFAELTAMVGSLVGQTIANPDAGVMRIRNFDFIGSYDPFNQLALSLDKKQYGTFGMVFKKANPIWAVLAKLPDTAISAANDNFETQNLREVA